MNSRRSRIFAPQLPCVASFLQCYLPPDFAWRVYGRNLKDLYPQLAVSPARWWRQQVGPRFQMDWFVDIKDEQLDYVGGPESWYWHDLHP